MDNLQAQLQRIQAQIAQEKSKGAAERNDAKIAQLEQDEADIMAQMDEAKKQAQNEAIEEKVHADTVPFAIEGVDFTQLPAELITVIELVVKADRRRIYAEHATELEEVQKQLSEASSNFAAELRATQNLTNKIESLNEEVGSLSEQLNDEKLSRIDAEQKRDAAAMALSEAKTEIDRLKSQIDDYQKAKVFGERESQNVIEAEPQEADAINEALKKLYVSIENWGSTNKVVKPDGTFELVKNKDLDEWSPITPPALGGAESADSFRNEGEEVPSAVAGNGGVQDSQPVGDSFRKDEDAQHAVGGDAALPPVVEQASVESRIKALEERVSKLEQGKTGVAA